MTTIYTKPQIDAMAVKIGGEIKAAKTTVTQSQGQSTTYAVSQKMITDSLSAFGTAAYKNVGAEAGNVMEVGAFGFGGNIEPIIVSSREDLFTKTKSRGSKLLFITSAGVADMPFAPYSFGMQLQNGGYDHLILAFDVNGGKSGYISKLGDGTMASTTFWTNTNATKDSNGFLRDSNSIAETVAADATGNVAVASIQAGVGAPKIAYKKLTGTTGGSGIDAGYPHGLNAAKILSVAVVITDSEGKYNTSPLGMTTSRSYTYNVDATNVVVKISSNTGNTIMIGRPITILITYEV